MRWLVLLLTLISHYMSFVRSFVRSHRCRFAFQQQTDIVPTLKLRKKMKWNETMENDNNNSIDGEWNILIKRRDDMLTLTSTTDSFPCYFLVPFGIVVLESTHLLFAGNWNELAFYNIHRLCWTIIGLRVVLCFAYAYDIQWKNKSKWVCTFIRLSLFFLNYYPFYRSPPPSNF